LAKAPTGTVRVAINPSDDRVVLESADPLGRFHTVSDPAYRTPGVYCVEFNAGNWNNPVLIKLHALNDNRAADPTNTTIIHSIDKAHTPDPVYNNTDPARAVAPQRLDVQVYDDEGPGVFTLETQGRTLVTAANPTSGPGPGDSYVMRLTSPPRPAGAG